VNDVSEYTIEREVVIEAPIDVVWRTVTQPDLIPQWFANRVELDLTPGGAGLLTFLNDEGEVTHTAPIVVETVDPPTLFSYRWCHPEGDVAGPDNSVLVEFTLVSEDSERTRLRVAEFGLEQLAWPEGDKVNYVEEHQGGWNHMTGRLVDVFAGSAGSAGSAQT
jgi:uncharacterized protein YndB with AHSA1/START domain